MRTTPRMLLACAAFMAAECSPEDGKTDRTGGRIGAQAKSPAKDPNLTFLGERICCDEETMNRLRALRAQPAPYRNAERPEGPELFRAWLKKAPAEVVRAHQMGPTECFANGCVALSYFRDAEAADNAASMFFGSGEFDNFRGFSFRSPVFPSTREGRPEVYVFWIFQKHGGQAR